MASKAQRRATSEHRRRAAARGVMRVEVKAAATDADLIRAVAEALRGESGRAGQIRTGLRNMLASQNVETAWDIFGSQLPDDTFDGVFEQPRGDYPRGVEL